MRRLFSANARQGFGSFHSADIEDLIRQDFVPPLRAQVVRDDRIAEFGNAARSKFGIDPQWLFLNHGAFGGAINPLAQEAEQWRKLCESQPLTFYDRTLLPNIAYSIQSMARFLNCPPTELFPLQNVTSGLNACIFSVDLKPKDRVVTLSLTYGSTKIMLNEHCRRHGAVLDLIPIPIPLTSSQELVEIFRAHISKLVSSGETIRLVVLDQITSNSAAVLPILELAQICKEAGAIVICDAAHSLVTLDVALYHRSPSLQPQLTDVVDAWITNCHKWFCSPKGAAFMWLGPALRPLVKPRVISHGYTPGKRLLSAFSWDGCRDYSALLTAPSGIALWEKRGLEAVRSYCRDTLLKGLDLLCESWKVALPVPRDMIRSMAIIPLPPRLKGINTQEGCNDTQAFPIQECLHHEHRVELPVKHFAGRLYFRLSCHIYNTLEDFEKLNRTIRSIGP